MGKVTTLQEYLDAISKIEQSKSCKPSWDFRVPSRLADSDVLANSFYAKFGLQRPRSRSFGSGQTARSSSHTPQSSGASNGSRSVHSRAGSSSSRLPLHQIVLEALEMIRIEGIAMKPESKEEERREVIKEERRREAIKGGQAKRMKEGRREAMGKRLSLGVRIVNLE